MPRTCTVCKHEKRAEIDAALVNSESYRNVSNQYGLSFASVQRHKAKHLPGELVKAQDAQDVLNADSLLTDVQALKKTAGEVMQEARTAEDYRGAVAAINAQGRLIELMLEAIGKLNRNPQVNILISAQWLEVRTAVLRALAPHPEARLAVVEALKNVESSQ